MGVLKNLEEIVAVAVMELANLIVVVLTEVLTYRRLLIHMSMLMAAKVVLDVGRLVAC